MSSRFQCKHCHDILTVGDKLIGKRIRCPLCRTALAVPEADPGRSFLEIDFPTQLERFRLSDWDRACAKKALELDMAKPEELTQAIRAVAKAARKGTPPALNEQLLADGVIEKSGNLALAELVKGMIKEQESKELIECPNCFAAIPAKSRECNLCGQKLGDLLVYDMCPNCKKEQPSGQEWCRACKANMATGLLPGVELPHCPRCNKIVEGKAVICPTCRTPLNASSTWIDLQRKIKILRDWWGNYSFAFIMVLVIASGLYAYSNWMNVKSWFVGRERAALDERVDHFSNAVKFDDLETLATFVDPDLKLTVTQATRTCILGGEDNSWVVKKVKVLKLSGVTFNEDKTGATVYAEVEGAFDPATIKIKEVKDITDISKAMKKVGKGALLRAKIPWKWIQRGGKWYYVGPVP